MIHKRARMSHLRFEELESRSMLAVVVAAPDVVANPGGSSDLVGDGVPAQVAAAAAASENTSFAGPGFTTVPGAAIVLTDNSASLGTPRAGQAPDAASGVGQMTIT